MRFTVNAQSSKSKLRMHSTILGPKQWLYRVGPTCETPDRYFLQHHLTLFSRTLSRAFTIFHVLPLRLHPDPDHVFNIWKPSCIG